MRRFPSFLAALLIGCASTVCLIGCAPAGDDDDSARVIPPPDGCNLTALSTVVFQFHLHWGGVDYPQGELVDLLNSLGFSEFVFPFVGQVTELGDDPDSNFQAITAMEVAPKGEEPLKDPNWLRVTYQLPLGYDLPVAFGDPLGVELNLNLSGEHLIAAFSLWDLPEDGDPSILFLAEPSELGMAYAPGDDHPLLQSVTLRDRACPNLTETNCASVYNLSLDVTSRLSEDGSAGGESFELWPTESTDFGIGGPEYRFVNAWSYAHREVQNCNNGYDYTAQRKSFFITRSEFAP